MNDAVNEVTSNELSDWRRLLTAGERAAMLRDIARVSLAVGPRAVFGAALVGFRSRAGRCHRTEVPCRAA